MKLTFRIQKTKIHKDMYRVIYPKDRQGFEADFSDSKSVPKPANTLLRTTIETSMSSDNQLITYLKQWPLLQMSY